MNTINGLENHKSHLLDIVQEIKGSNNLIEKLFDAAKNNDIDFFFFPDNKKNKMPDEFFDRWKELRTIFQKVIKTLGNDWISELYLSIIAHIELIALCFDC